jgi:hypothetical protein
MQEVADVSGGSSGRWSRRSPQQLPMDAGSRGWVRRPPCLHCGDHLQQAPLPTSQLRRLGLHHPLTCDAGRGSAGRRHELNHGGQTALILALLPRLWVLRGHWEEGMQRRVTDAASLAAAGGWSGGAGSAEIAWGMGTERGAAAAAVDGDRGGENERCVSGKVGRARLVCCSSFSFL